MKKASHRRRELEGGGGGGGGGGMGGGGGGAGRCFTPKRWEMTFLESLTLTHTHRQTQTSPGNTADIDDTETSVAPSYPKAAMGSFLTRKALSPAPSDCQLWHPGAIWERVTAGRVWKNPTPATARVYVMYGCSACGCAYNDYSPGVWGRLRPQLAGKWHLMFEVKKHHSPAVSTISKFSFM